MSSVINLTPQYLLEEIVLVDDMSDFDDLKEKLDHRLEIFRGKIKLIRNKQREGLIRSRLIGAARASGMSLSFIQDLTRYLCAGALPARTGPRGSLQVSTGMNRRPEVPFSQRKLGL